MACTGSLDIHTLQLTVTNVLLLLSVSVQLAGFSKMASGQTGTLKVPEEPVETALPVT